MAGVLHVMYDSLSHRVDEHELLLINTAGETEFLKPRPMREMDEDPEVGTKPTKLWID
jgi:hypothetical protein